MIINADSKVYLSTLTENTIDLIVTDPPYGLEFLGKNWDKALPQIGILYECLRVLKHGAFAFWLCSPRQDLLSRMITLLDLVGFKVNFTSLYWTYASGFPKSQNISKAIDKKLGLEREIIGENPNNRPNTMKNGKRTTPSGYETYEYNPLTKPNSPEAQEMEGSYGGFQPKPAVEVILVTMKPLSEKTYLEQALKNGKGVTWLDSGRIPISEEIDFSKTTNRIPRRIDEVFATSGFKKEKDNTATPNINGRFPANLLVSDKILDTGKIGEKSSRFLKKFDKGGSGNSLVFSHNPEFRGFDDIGDFSRYFDLDQWFTQQIPFFIVPKPSKTEKNLGLDTKPELTNRKTGMLINDSKDRLGQQERELGNFHPTCKPIALKSYLIAIGSRKGDTILDPFVGSGTTSIAAEMLARKHLGIEKEQDYYEIAKERVKPENIRALIAFLKEQLPKLPKKKETKILTEFI